MLNIIKTTPILIGTRIYTGLYNRGYGTVYAIHGKQVPESVRVVGGIMHSGGNAEFDIVFDCGAISARLPECILRGVQWNICEEVATTVEIAGALAHSACVTASKKAAEQQAKEAFNREVERLKAAPEYAYLKQQEGTIYSGKLAAVNVRAELKRVFKGVKFSVRSDHNSVRVSWTDGPTESQVEALTSSYKAGHFNGMEDIYEYSKSPWTEVFGSATYLSVSREESPELAQKAIDALFDEFPSNFKDIKKPTGQAFKRGETWNIDVPGLWERLQTLISRKLTTIAA
jgi:hypothetical protein